MMPFDSNTLTQARERLLRGDVVAIPTETVYGLAASIASEAGLRKVFALKKRPFFDPLIVHVASFKQAESVVREWLPLADYIARMFWPGPLTLVLPKADHINSLITSGLDTVAVRYPAHPLAQDLIKLTGTPLAAPSANKFGRTSPSCASHVRAEFADEASDLLIIDGGPCEVGLESTVISFQTQADGSTDVLILRPGAITAEMLEQSLKRWSHPARVQRAQSEASPGHLKHHYMPKIPLVIVPENETSPLSEASKKKAREALGLKDIRNPMELILDENPELAARELYSEMRRLSESGADILFVRHSEARSHGLWQAIWDRLSRASTLDIR